MAVEMYWMLTVVSLVQLGIAEGYHGCHCLAMFWVLVIGFVGFLAVEWLLSGRG